MSVCFVSVILSRSIQAMSLNYLEVFVCWFPHAVFVRTNTTQVSFYEMLITFVFLLRGFLRSSGCSFSGLNNDADCDSLAGCPALHCVLLVIFIVMVVGGFGCRWGVVALVSESVKIFSCFVPNFTTRLGTFVILIVANAVD